MAKAPTRRPIATACSILRDGPSRNTNSPTITAPQTTGGAPMNDRVANAAMPVTLPSTSSR